MLRAETSRLPQATGVENAAVVGGAINPQNDSHGGSEGKQYDMVPGGSYSSMRIATIKARDGWNIRSIRCQTNVSPLTTETSRFRGATRDFKTRDLEAFTQVKATAGWKHLRNIWMRCRFEHFSVMHFGNPSIFTPLVGTSGASATLLAGLGYE